MTRDEETGRAWVADMTLETATAWLRPDGMPGCACVGGPWCCRFSIQQAKNLRRAAHIAVRQFADLAAARR